MKYKRMEELRGGRNQRMARPEKIRSFVSKRGCRDLKPHNLTVRRIRDRKLLAYGMKRERSWGKGSDVRDMQPISNYFFDCKAEEIESGSGDLLGIAFVLADRDSVRVRVFGGSNCSRQQAPPNSRKGQCKRILQQN